MAITFQRIKWKNFLSTGDNYTSIDLNTGTDTLVVGPNGSGKSTLLDALSFALFGKPHRDINKPQLVNSINNRNCEVEVEFMVGKAQFRIIRGMKPGIFEIWQNGVLVNQEAHSLDYQKVLEQNILKLNHKSFHQIVVLGSSSFVPFMQLPAQHRREVIEDLLDINIFTKMNGILKERVARLRDRLQEVTYAYDLNTRSADMQRKFIAGLKKKNAEAAQKNQDKIVEYQQQIKDLMAENASDTAILEAGQAEAQKRSNELHDRKQSLLMYQAQIRSNITKVVKESKFYEENDSCPTCSQTIAIDVKNEKVHKCKDTAKNLAAGQFKLEAELTKVHDELDSVNADLKMYSEVINRINGRNSSIAQFQKLIGQLEAESVVQSDSDLAEAEAKLTEYVAELENLTNAKADCYEQGSYNSAISEMLKDTGIKTKIIRQYLPVMNKLINGYLQTLDFFVAFHLDESFEETIKSRHRDDFSYASFSEGEKQRIDLALLFTWRQIARMKNSVSTNLLILDETFDSSMDTDGVENLLKIIKTLDDKTSVFVISHKVDALDGKFRNRIEFHKEKNFSQIKQK